MGLDGANLDCNGIVRCSAVFFRPDCTTSLLAVLRAVRWRLNRECCAELCSIPRRIGSGVIMGARFGSEGLRKDQKIKLRRYVGDRSP